MSRMERPLVSLGTTEQPLAHSAQEYLLVRPEIAEALEYTHRERIGQEKPTLSIDGLLALEGLNWLQQHLSLDSDGNSLRGDVTRATNSLFTESREVRVKIENEDEQRRQTEQAVHRAHREKLDSEIDAVLGAIQETSPDLEFGGLRILIGTLHSFERPDGTIGVSEYKGFPITVNKLVSNFLEEPTEFLNDMTVIKRASHFLSYEEHEATYPIAAAHVGKIESAMDQTLSDGTFGDLAEHAMEGLFFTISSAEDLEAADLFLGTEVLHRSLVEMAQQDPVRFIDRLHMIARTGLDPENEIAHAAAFRIIGECLRGDALAASALGVAYKLEGAQMTGTRQQAIDLVLTLNESGLRFDSYYSDARYSDAQKEGVKPEQLDAMKAMLVPTLIDNNGESQNSARSQATDFKAFAITPEGRESTLYGRLTDNRERPPEA